MRIDSRKWGWLPKRMREPAAKAELFSARGDRALHIGIACGKGWATDGHYMIHIGTPADAVAARAHIGVGAHELPRKHIPTLLSVFDHARRVRTVREPEEAGLFAPYELPCVVLGRVAVQRPAYEMVNAIWPDAQWYSVRRDEPAFAAVGGDIVAALMPVLLSKLRKEAAACALF